MPTVTFTHELLADTSDDPLLTLITVEHPDLAEPLRFTTDRVATISRGMTFNPYPFEFAAPGEGDEGATAARIVIDNIDQRIVQTLRALASPPTALIEIVLGSDPDTVEETFPPFEIRTASGDRMQVSADLTDIDDDAQPLTRFHFVPSMAPALFN